MARASDASQYWAFLFYDDNNEYEKLIEKITNLGLLCAVSPLHDSDIDPKSDTGEMKKAHRHIAVKFPSKVGSRAVRDGLTGEFKGIPKVIQRLLNPAKFVDYLTHENQPLKHHYSRDDIIWLNNATFEDFPDEFQLNKKERKKKEDMEKTLAILDLIQQTNPKSLLELSLGLRDEPEYLQYIVDHSFYFDRIISGKSVSTQSE